MPHPLQGVPRSATENALRGLAAIPETLFDMGGNLFFDIGATGAELIQNPNLVGRAVFGNRDAASEFQANRTARRERLPTFEPSASAAQQQQAALAPIIPVIQAAAERFPNEAETIGQLLNDPSIQTVGQLIESVGLPVMRGARGVQRAIQADLGAPGKGSRNFVLFDEKDVTILKRNGEVVGPPKPAQVPAGDIGTPKAPVAATSPDTGLPMDKASRKARAKELGFTRQAFHASTFDIDEFDLSKANPESDWGAGIYSTTSKQDATINYSNLDGADLTQKIEMRAEQIDGTDEVGMDAARKQATQEIAGGKENVMKLRTRLDKPFRIGGNKPTFLESDFPEPDIEDFIDEARDLADDARFQDEPEGPLVDFIVSLRNSGHPDANTPADKLSDFITEGVTAKQLDEIMRDHDWFTEGPNGENFNTEVYRQALEDAGFDGVIDSNVFNKFGFGSGRVNTMEGIERDTQHIIMFGPSQARKAKAVFDPAKRGSSNLLATHPAATAGALLAAGTLAGEPKL